MGTHIVNRQITQIWVPVFVHFYGFPYLIFYVINSYKKGVDFVQDKKPYIVNGERVGLEEYRKTKYEDLRVRVPKGKKSELQEHAIKQGESLNGFVNRAIDNQVKIDKEGGQEIK